MTSKNSLAETTLIQKESRCAAEFLILGLMLARAEGDESALPGGVFATTHWSVVLTAGQGEEKARDVALEKLCQTYWYPLYAYARRCGHAPADAEDLTQGLFERLLSRDALAEVAPERGRFRSFLLACFNHHTADERDRAQRMKRGGRREYISLDSLDAEERYRHEPVDKLDPEKLFERRWALTALEQVLDRLKAELTAAGKEKLFEHLQSFVTSAGGAARQAEIAERLGMSENAVAVAVHRLRGRYRELLREEVAQTVAGPAAVDEEMRHLRAALRG
jgi:RNA polymerase sigma factor (sigma-70 family)